MRRAARPALCALLVLLPAAGQAQSTWTVFGPKERPVVQGDEALAAAAARLFFEACIDRRLGGPEQIARAEGWASFDPLFHPISTNDLRLEESSTALDSLFNGQGAEKGEILRGAAVGEDRKPQLKRLVRRAWAVKSPAGELLLQTVTAPAVGRAPAVDVCAVAAVGVDQESFTAAAKPELDRRAGAPGLRLYVEVGRLRDWRTSIPPVRLEEPQKRSWWQPKQARWRTALRPYEPTSAPPTSMTRTGEPYLAVTTTL